MDHWMPSFNSCEIILESWCQKTIMMMLQNNAPPSSLRLTLMMLSQRPGRATQSQQHTNGSIDNTAVIDDHVSTQNPNNDSDNSNAIATSPFTTTENITSNVPSAPSPSSSSYIGHHCR